MNLKTNILNQFLNIKETKEEIVMNSRKKRFWKLWQKRNEDLAMTNVEEANKIRYSKFLGESLPDYIQCFDYKA